MSKKLLYAGSVRPGSELHEKLLEGVSLMADAVGSTLGPRGLNVIIDRAGDIPLVTKDGVTVARNIQLTDPVLQSAVKMMQDVARATVDEAGDGTTTATVLAHAIFSRGLQAVKNGANPIALQRHIEGIAMMASNTIRDMAKPCTPDQLAQVATIATNGNEAFGRLMKETIERVGIEGNITLDDSDRPEVWMEFREGFQLPAGFSDPFFITDRKRNLAVLENPYILITEKQLSQGAGSKAMLHDIGPLLMFCAGLNTAGNSKDREPRPLLVVADDVMPGSDALQTFQLNHSRGILQVCIVRAPGFGEAKRTFLQDLAMATGGEVLRNDSGDMLSQWVLDKKGNFDGSRLGQCSKAVVSNSRTVLVDVPGDAKDPELMKAFAASLREQAAEASDPMAREFLLQRAARLTGSVAVLHVGAPTEAAARTLRDAAEDAVLAVRCAADGGIVAGGGLALLTVAEKMSIGGASLKLGDDKTLVAAWQVMADAMREPMRRIASNAGLDPEEVLDTVRRMNVTEPGTGYNAASGQYEVLMQAGVVDPAKVVRTALEKAASIASLMLTSSCLIYIDPDANKNQPIIQLPQPAASA